MIAAQGAGRNTGKTIRLPLSTQNGSKRSLAALASLERNPFADTTSLDSIKIQLSSNAAAIFLTEKEAKRLAAALVSLKRNIYVGRTIIEDLAWINDRLGERS
jgi:hypothetical protein